ncbi:MAG: N(G),N(G)-dimethylarginine dimethylaminohydrolase [Jiangellaceae bacterium]|nr:N(G),N(G)-dimethylarginine dimethylaminohydrolase [Jiangellaceae bacterium]
MSRGVALVRAPSDRLAEGVVTHIARAAVDVELAKRQHREYVDALRSAGWTVREVAPAPDCPDSVFVEDTVIVCDDVAVLTRPGLAARRAEVDGTEAAVRDLPLRVAHIVAPAMLDGGDVLQVGSSVYVGVGGRTNAAGVEQLRAHLAGLGRRVVAVRLTGVLHLKSAVTALPDGTLLARPDRIDHGALPDLRAVDEEAGCHVVPLGGGQVLLAASAPRTAQWLRTNGWFPVVVDISEFEKLEGCVTCLTVLVPSPSGMTTFTTPVGTSPGLQAW